MSVHHPFRGSRRLRALLPAVIATTILGGCGAAGSGGQSASSLLRQTFSGAHPVISGDLTLSLNVTPVGSTTLTKPITLAFGGPFQSRGKGQLPASDFTVTIGAQGASGSLQIISTGTKGYVTFGGTSYVLPAANFQKLESSFSSLERSGSGTSGSGSSLGKLGIDPMRWLKDPAVVGTATIGGAETTHIRAQVNVSALLHDLNTLLSKAGSIKLSATTKLPTSISPATQAKIAREVQDPSIDVWTGNRDKTVRRLSLALTLPVTGQMSTLFGGMRSAGLSLTLAYSDLNQPQTISAPASAQPYSVFETKIKALLSAVSSTVSSGSGGSTTTTTGTTGTTGTTATTGSTGTTDAYSNCIRASGGDVMKMQKCASLLGSG